MTLARCRHDDCAWEVDFPTESAAQTALDRHNQLRHPEDSPAPPPAPTVAPSPVPQLANVDWRTQALDALAQLARTRGQFTVFDVAELGVPEPPSPRTDWGKLTRDAEHLGLIKHLTDSEGREVSVRSKRPATKGSLVSVWTAGRRTA